MQTQMLIGGEFVAGDGQTEEILNPATGETIAPINSASSEQVDAAVAAAAAAFPAWSRTTPAERALMLLRLADRIEAEAEAFARLESQNCGKPPARALADELRRSSTASASSPAPPAACPAAPPASTWRATPAWCGAIRSAWSPPSRPGTIRS
jgi:acyl-CoA reductase-like NAD-dependent aldehyde dehydrogenase